MAEGARLESVYAGNRIEGSNPSPSANATVLLRVYCSGKMPVQFKIELAALFSWVSDYLVNQATECISRFLTRNFVGIEGGLQICQLPLMRFDCTGMPIDLGWILCRQVQFSKPCLQYL